MEIPVQMRFLRIAGALATLTLAACGGDRASPLTPSSTTASSLSMTQPGGFGLIVTPAGGSSVVNLADCLRQSPAPGCFSTAAHGRLGAMTAALTAPSAPINLIATSAGSAVSLTWSAPASGDAVSAYVIEAGSASGRTDLANFSTGNASTSFFATGVGAGSYFVRVRAINGGGTSAASNEAVLVVGSRPCTTPGPPSDLTIVTNAGGTVVLSWNAAAGSPTSYVVEAGSAPGLANLANSDLGGTALSMTATGVGPGTYYVRTRAKNACGASSPSNETVVIVGSPTPTGRVRYNTDPGVSSSDQNVIRQAIDLAQSYFASAFGWTTTRDISIAIKAGANGGITAQASGTMMTIYVGSPYWPIATTHSKNKVIVHEFFHILQSAIGWGGGVWLVEGSAEYVGYQAAFVAAGAASAEQVRGCKQWDVDRNGSALPPLSQLEGSGFYDPSGAATAYSLAYLATERAVSVHGIASLVGFGQRITSAQSWPTAFGGAFGIDLNAFYSQFEQYRHGWSAPRTYTCEP